jgi:hypothetical protein
MSFQAKIGFSAIFTATSLFLVSGTPAKAVACVDGTLTAVQAAGICTDAVGFTFKLNSFTKFNGSDTFSFQSSANNFQYSLQGASAWNSAGNTYSINYTVTAPSGKQLNFFTSNLSSANDPDNDAGGYSIASAAQPATGPAAATFVPQFQAAGGIAIYSPKLTSDTYTGSLTVNGGTIATVTGAVASQPIPSPSPVPGPLPLLGASAGFAISRKLRNRIKSEA